MRLAAILAACMFGLTASGQAVNGEQRMPHAVPTDQQLQQAELLIQEVYGKSIEAARTQRQKIEVAEQLVQQSEATSNTPVHRFALLVQARELATECGDFEMAIDIVERLSSSFAVDAPQLKLDALRSLAQNDLSVSQCRVLGEHVGHVIDECVAANRFDVARQAAELAARRFRRVRDEEHLKAFVQRLNRIDELDRQYDAVQQAAAHLEQEPMDATSNLVVGR